MTQQQTNITTSDLVQGQGVVHGTRAKWLYQFLGWKFRDATDWRFMNYGYAFDDPSMRPNLNSDDELERYCAQLYHVVAGQIDLTGKRVLDVGSGRGGGASHVHRYLNPAETIGLDQAETAVSFCNDLYKDVAGLSFTAGDAMDLPFEAASFDAVTNVESSHCYPDRAQFFREVHRVLKSGGSFLYTDFFPAGQRACDQLKQAGFELLETTDITDNVLYGLDVDHARREKEIHSRFPFGMRKAICLWAGTRDSWIYRDFADRKRDYVMYRAVKAE